MKGPDQTTRFNEVWDSWEYLLREDLERMYHRLDRLRNEAQLNGVRNGTIQTELAEKFWSLWKQIGKEETA